MFIVELEISDGFEEKQSRMNAAANEAYKAGVKFWRDNYLKGHFKSGAAHKYNYKRRSSGYIKRKMRQNKPLNALVYSGRSRDWLTNAGFFRVSGGRKQAVGRFTVPSTMRYFWMTPSGHPNKPEELKRVVSKEEREIGEFIKTRFLQNLESVESKSRKVR